MYYAMGEKRSMARLRQEVLLKNDPDIAPMLPSLTVMKKWSTEFNWQERIQQRDIEISKKMEQKTNTTILNQKADYRKLIKEAIDDWYKKFADGKAGPENVSDLEKLIKLDLLLMGEATDKNDGQPINIIIKGV